MKGTIKADKHFVTFSFDPFIIESMERCFFIGPEYCKIRGYVQYMVIIGDISYMVDIMPQDEAREMYE